MNQDDWLWKILTVVDAIASREYQLGAWFGFAGSVSSPDELYNQLFDDATFALFFKQYSAEFSEIQKSAWKELEGKLESYAGVMPRTMNPYTVFNDPRWEDIRESARRFLGVFKGSPRTG
jgi:hypothetical protein